MQNWKEERKEWQEYEDDKKKERELAEKKRVEEMERFKTETRENLNSVMKSMTEGLQVAVKNVTDEMKKNLSPSTESPASPRMEESPMGPRQRILAPQCDAGP